MDMAPAGADETYAAAAAAGVRPPKPGRGSAWARTVAGELFITPLLLLLRGAGAAAALALAVVGCHGAVATWRCELNDRWWWRQHGLGALPHERRAHLVSKAGLWLLCAAPAWLRELGPVKRRLQGFGIGADYATAIDGLAAAPTVRAAMGALGMNRVSDYLWKPATVSQTPSPWTAPLLRPIFYCPGLAAEEFYTSDRFPELRELERNYKVVQAELKRALKQFSTYVIPPNGQESSMQKVQGWSTCEFISVHGKWKQETIDACPETWKMLTKMKRFIPNTLCMFSRVQGGGRIRSHTGLTNLAVRVHLALEVPEPHRTVIRVGEQVRTWEEGKCLIFNDAFDHQVWNTGTKTRTVLFFDLWHPDLTDADLEAIAPAWANLRDYGEIADKFEKASKEKNA